MATDIWIHLEYKKSLNSDKWEHMTEPWGDRLYYIFGALVGERHPELEHIPARGLPDNISDITLEKFKDGEGDFHTPSWVTAEELLHSINVADEAIKIIYSEEGIEYKPNWCRFYQELYDIMATYDAIGKPARMVFWFDN